MNLTDVNRKSIRIAGIYLVVGILWILFSDQFLASYYDIENHPTTTFQTYKGGLFVLVTAVLIYLLSRNSMYSLIKVREKLDFSEQRYHDILDNIPIGIYNLDLNGRLTFVNSFILELVELPGEYLQNNGWSSRIHEADRERVVTKLADIIEHGGLFCERYRIQKGDQTVRWVFDIGQPEINRSGQCVGYRGTLADITSNIESDLKLQARETLLNKLMQFSPDSIALLSPEGVILREYSGAFPQTLGLDPEEVHGLNIKDMAFDEDIPGINNIFKDVMSSPGKVVSHEARVKGKNGETYWLDYTFTNMLDDPSIGAIVGNGRNITERKRVESELVQNELKFRTLVEASLTGVYLIQNGQFIYANPKLQQILGYNKDELYQMPSMLEVVHEDDRELVKTNLQRRVTGELDTAHYTFRCRHKQGYAIHVEAHGSRMVWNGQAAVIGTLLDISERMRMINSLKQSEARFHQALENIPDVIVIYDRDHRIQYINESIRQITNKPASSFIGKRDKGIWLPEMYAAHSTVLETNTTQSIDVDLDLPDTGIHSLKITCVPILDETGEVNEIMGIVHDYTERKQAEQKERELQDKLNLAITAADIGFWDWNLKTNKVFYSKEWKKQLGFSEDEITDDYSEWENRIHPDDLEQVLERFHECIEHPENVYFNEYRLRHKNGTYRWFMSQGEVKSDAGGEPGHIFGSNVDISYLKKAELLLSENQARMEHLLSANPTVLYSLRFENNRFVPGWVSDNITRISGYTVEEALQPDWWRMNLHSEDRDRCLQETGKLQDKDHLIFEYRFLHKKGYSLYIQDAVRILRNRNGEIEEVIGSWIDITRQHEEHEKNRLYATAFENTSDGVIITALNGKILSANKAFFEITGYSEEELLGKNPRMLQSGRHDRPFYQNMWEHLLKSGRWSGEVWNRRKNGELYPQWLSINVVYDDIHQPSHYVGISTDITHLKDTESRLEHLAHYDALTDLPNRMLLHSRIEHAIHQAARNVRLLGILVIDLDDFKKINDSLGHPAGDELLLAVSRRWQSRLREEDTFARLGGDEFVILLEDIKKVDEAATVAQDLLSTLSRPIKLTSGEEIYVEASIGISIYPDDGASVDELLRDADTAMYRSKELGRNRFSYYTSELGTSAAERLELETSLRQSIERNELLLHFQPKVDLHTGKISGAEALLRWNRSGQDLVPPGKFISLAERTGLIIPIGEWVIKTVCQQLQSWREAGEKPIRIAVNISAQQFHGHKLGELIVDTLNAYKLKPEWLELEITESTLMEKPDEVISMLGPLRKMGIKIALDDFGTGYSNIAYLSSFPIDELKIDASFVRNLESDPNAVRLINSVIKLAKSLNLLTLAEGVETREQLDFLRQFNCDEMQGYYFSKPVSAEDFALLLHEHKSLETM